MAKRYAPVDLTADTSKLSAGDKAAIAKLIEAAKIVDTLQLRQRWSGNEALWAALKKDTVGAGQGAPATTSGSTRARGRILDEQQVLHAGRIRRHQDPGQEARRRQLLSGRRQQGSRSKRG